MSIAESMPTGNPVTRPEQERSWVAKNWGLLAAVAVLIGILLLPTPAALPVAGHRMLAILAFAVIVWMTEAIDYAVAHRHQFNIRVINMSIGAGVYESYDTDLLTLAAKRAVSRNTDGVSWSRPKTKPATPSARSPATCWRIR